MKNKYFLIDFDSTFIKIEAMEELAKISLANNPDKDKIINEIIAITNSCMNGTMSIAEGLNARIKLLAANKSHIEALIPILKIAVSNSFKRNRIFFEECADNIFIVSNGFIQYIEPVVIEYGVKKENILANSFIYDESGNITSLDESNDLSRDSGKISATNKLNLDGEISIIGDGFTDYEVKQAGVAKFFYAFTENVSRENVITNADYITPSLDEFLYINKLPRSTSYPKSRIKVLLLENVHARAVELFKEEGYSVETIKSSIAEDELCQKIKNISILGIRSKTTVTAKILDNANNLLSIGAFCIGTNQIENVYAASNGICVFNAPYSNTRSVVELAIGEIIMLMRNVLNKSNKLHSNVWDKSANNSFEIRGKKLGIVGYGNIGSQLSVLAESLGMQVYYYDLIERLQLGNARKCTSLEELLQIVDIVTLHVDGRGANTNIIGEREFTLMNDNVIFLNLSRGHIVDIEALARNLKNGKILGAAVDVFPYEPQSNQEKFVNELCGVDNVILTPHIGGSTEEAQLNIGEFVAKRIISYINTGDSIQSINLPNIQLPELGDAHRLIHLHHNVPGIIAKINTILANHDINIIGQYLKTNENVGYVITDIATTYNSELIEELQRIEHTIKLRVLY